MANDRVVPIWYRGDDDATGDVEDKWAHDKFDELITMDSITMETES